MILLVVVLIDRLIEDWLNKMNRFSRFLHYEQWKTNDGYHVTMITTLFWIEIESNQTMKNIRKSYDQKKRKNFRDHHLRTYIPDLFLKYNLFN